MIFHAFNSGILWHSLKNPQWLQKLRTSSSQLLSSVPIDLEIPPNSLFVTKYIVMFVSVLTCFEMTGNISSNFPDISGHFNTFRDMLILWKHENIYNISSRHFQIFANIMLMLVRTGKQFSLRFLLILYNKTIFLPTKGLSFHGGFRST